MSTKNFMAFGDAESVLTGFANKIKSLVTKVGTATLDTTAKDLSSAVNELYARDNTITTQNVYQSLMLMRLGKLVVISGAFTTSAQTTSNQVMVDYAFPKPLKHIYVVPVSSTITSSIYLSDVDGKIKSGFTSPAQTYYVTFVYVTND